MANQTLYLKLARKLNEGVLLSKSRSGIELPALNELHVGHQVQLAIDLNKQLLWSTRTISL